MRPILAICLGLLCAAPAFAQEAWQVERTPDGKPDLHGVWATRFITRLERAPGAASLEVSPEEAGEIAAAIATRISSTAVNDPDFAFYGFDQLASVNGKFRTALIVDPEDGKIPFTPAGAERDERFSTLESYGFDHPEERPGYERCLSGILAAPIRVLPMLIPMRIVQTPEAVVLTNEDVQGLRIIPLGGPQSPSAIRPLDGVGRGRWDGDTLVVDTSNFRADDIARPDMGPPIVLSETTRITERFTRIAQNELLYRFTVEDSTLYTQPWSAEFVMTLEEGGVVHEYACHEANYSMTNMLLAGRLGRQSKPPADE